MMQAERKGRKWRAFRASPGGRRAPLISFQFTAEAGFRFSNIDRMGSRILNVW